MKLNQNKFQEKGNLILVVGVLLLLVSAASYGFLRSSDVSSKIEGLALSQRQLKYDLEGVINLARNNLERSTSGMFTGLQTQDIVQFASDSEQAEAFLENGLDSFAQNFPSEWSNMPSANDPRIQVRYRFKSLQARVSYDPLIVVFDYGYRIQARAQQSGASSQQEVFRIAEDMGTFTLQVEAAPFSRWAIFRDSRFRADSDTDQVFLSPSEVFEGPVHFNDRPAISGNPTFRSWLTWSDGSTTPSGPNYAEDYDGNRLVNNTAATVEIPENLYNIARLSINGIHSEDVFNTGMESDTVTTEEYRQELHVSAGRPVLPINSDPLPKGVYVPHRNGHVKGGVFIEGNAKKLELGISTHSDLSINRPDFYNKIYVDSALPSGCRLQKIYVDHEDTTPGEWTEDYYIFVTEPNCSIAKTFVFTNDPNSGDPIGESLDGRTNGLVYTRGNVRLGHTDSAGQPINDRPSIIKDMQMTLATERGDVQLVSNIMYEDAEFHEINPETGEVEEEVHTTPTGYPNDDYLVTRMPENSKTLFGVIVNKGRVHVMNEQNRYTDNIVLHASIFAASEKAPPGESWCKKDGTPAYCGFGADNHDEYDFRGGMNLFGSLSENRTWAVGTFNTDTGVGVTGYKKRFTWDPRLAISAPPAFPRSNIPLVSASVLPSRTWRLVSSDQASSMDHAFNTYEDDSNEDEPEN